ncbi:MAG: hypothetical protein ABIA63_02125 [bacterium]
MSIEYEESNEQKNLQTYLTFDMVEEKQFFYNRYGMLCQKINNDYYQQIAEKGIPYTSYPVACNRNRGIKAICKKIKKISIEIEQGEK